MAIYEFNGTAPGSSGTLSAPIPSTASTAGSTSAVDSQIAFNVVFSFSPNSPTAVGFQYIAHSVAGGLQIQVAPTVPTATTAYDLIVSFIPQSHTTLGPAGFSAMTNPIIDMFSAFAGGSGAWQVSFVGGAGGGAVGVGPGTYTETSGGSDVSAIRFTLSGATGSSSLFLDSINATIVCFCAGTAIATPDGTTLVEDLRPGDRILTATGAETTVKWLGQQPVSPRFQRPEKVNPICISAGALGNGLPLRDLRVSGDHAIEIDGVLYNAGALVNGQSITQVAEMPLDGFTYYHIETDAHQLILAEGVAAETYLDGDWQSGFINEDARDGDASITEMDLPRITTARLVPQGVRDRLAVRAGLRVAA